MRGSKILTALALLGLPHVACAGPGDPELCDAAAQKASAESGVPLDILLAITRAETGRRIDGKLAPWPWAINDDGQGFWFESEDQALQAAEARIAAGDDNFDIGCFQINTRWHGQSFASVNDMFDPAINAHYAAKFLTELAQETGSWDGAISAYHSRTPELAGPYLARVNALRGLPVDPVAPVVRVAETAADHPNLFPLLQSGAQGSAGSLVPLQSGLAPLFSDRG